MMTVIKVDVISDIVCVWCYIGKRTLERAIRLYQETYPNGKNDEFIVTWHPYYLNYNASGASVEKSKLRAVKLKDWTPQRIAAAKNRVEEAGRSVGINFRHGGKIGHTRDAHVLIHRSQDRAKPADVRDALVENIFHAYHELETDIADRDILRGLAEDAGITAAEADEWLDSADAAHRVDEEALYNREKVSNGVPTFLIQDQYRVDGAQDLNEFLEAFVKVKETDLVGRTRESNA